MLSRLFGHPRFDGKRIWITGASSGIGAALAKAFSRRGAALLLSARRVEPLTEVQRVCEANGAHVRLLPLDLEDTPSLRVRAREALETFGAIDILVNNAGLGQSSLALETDLAVTEQIMRVNFLGTVALTQALLPSMVARRQGQVVVVSSLLGKFGVQRRSSYAASKHALHGYFDSLRLELAPDGVQVSVLCPGWVDTGIDTRALQGDGSARGTNSASNQGMSAQAFSEEALRMIAARRDEAYIGGSEVNGVWVKRLAPSLLRRVLAVTRID